jgi:TonB family protein
MTFHQLLGEWSQWFWPIFANHLLQATLFVLVVWIAVKMFNQAPAQFRYFLWRVRHPVIVLPEGVAGRLSDEEIEAVMTHELVHALHRDNLIGSLQMIVCSLLWFHPLAWLIDRRLLAEREIWCDETVIRLGGEPKLYATSLWKVVQFGLGWPVAAVSRAAGSNLKRRIERMLTSNNQFEMTSARHAAAYASFFVLAFLAVAVGLFGGDSAFAQRNKIEATTKKGVAEGVKGGVPGGVSSGVRGGVRGGAPGGVSSGVRGGVSGGIEGSAHAVAQPGNPTAAVTQEPGSQTKDKQMRRRARPLILYKEKAQYTQEARDNNVEGTVVLRVVFGADSQINIIEVIRGLPHGLTEKAVEAAKKIRFEPATKDDQPVSVPGKLEYVFKL